MRVTAETKERTRARILKSARNLFRARGFHQTSTRDLAVTAGIATGTLFNYFRTKDELAAALIAEALDRVESSHDISRRGDESLAEDLFTLVTSDLRQMAPLRGIVGRVVETAMSPFIGDGASTHASAFRERHLESFASTLHTHGHGHRADAVAVHLYWSLYLGVLAFWSRDGSPQQEDTLALVDRSMRLFATSLEHAKE